VVSEDEYRDSATRGILRERLSVVENAMKRKANWDFREDRREEWTRLEARENGEDLRCGAGELDGKSAIL
jgi:hypothetical protein